MINNQVNSLLAFFIFTNKRSIFQQNPLKSSQEEKLGQHFEYPSGSQGYRLRCRLLFKFDLCRSNFIRVRAAYHPEISTNWPEPVMRALTERLAMDDGEDYGDDYYNSYSSYNNFNNHINGVNGVNYDN